MAFDLLNIQPHKVSRDLSGYITFIYGPAKVGKTTFASKMPDCLLLAFERGYNALPGVFAIDITSWGDVKQVARELKKPEVKARYKTIAIDTADIAADLCQKYICNQLGIENIGDGGWSTNGWAKYKKEFEDTFRTLTQLGYAVVFLSHEKEKTIKPQSGTEYQQIDIIGYAHPIVDANGQDRRVLSLRSPDNSIRCGCRFSQIAPVIDFSYDALTKALNDAIDKEAQSTNNAFVTDERQADPILKEYDYESLIAEFQALVGDLMNKNSSHYGPRITQIVDKYLGKGKKVAEATIDQAEFIHLINSEIKDELCS